MVRSVDRLLGKAVNRELTAQFSHAQAKYEKLNRSICAAMLKG